MKAKKLAALFLALALAFSAMTMPATAAETEGVMRKPAYRCVLCGGYAEMVTSRESAIVKVAGCSLKPNKPHYHDATVITTTFKYENGHNVDGGSEVFVGGCR